MVSAICSRIAGALLRAAGSIAIVCTPDRF
jgi:hypothetical protein